MTVDTFTKAQLALWAWRSAPAGKSFQAMQCLAFIMRNRAKAGWLGGDYLALIANDAAYSAYLMNGAPAGLEDFPDLRDDTFQRFLWEIDHIATGERGDPMTEGALYWAELHRVSRPWFRLNITMKPEQHPRVAQVATLTLWR